MSAAAPLNAPTGPASRIKSEGFDPKLDLEPDRDEIEIISDIELVSDRSSDFDVASAIEAAQPTPLKPPPVELGWASDPAMPIIYFGVATFIAMMIGWAILALV